MAEPPLVCHSGCTYDNAGRRTQVTRPGGYTSCEYNARDWLTAVRNRTTGGAIIRDVTYSYADFTHWENTGNPLWVAYIDQTAKPYWMSVYLYDRLGRLTQDRYLHCCTAEIYWLNYGYDAVGNRTSRADMDMGGATVTYTYDPNDKLTSASDGSIFGYDADGNMTSTSGPLGSRTLVHDDENRPSSITYPTGTDSFLWNALGQRMRAVLNATAVRYVYHGDRVLEERTDAGVLTARYTTENGSYYAPWLHMQRFDTSASRFPLYDGIGSMRALVDQNRAINARFTPDAYGMNRGWAGSHYLW